MEKLRPRPEKGQEIDPPDRNPAPPDRFLPRRARRASLETRRPRPEHQPAAPRFPAHPPMDAVVTEAPFILTTLRRCGVPSRDRRDVAQLVLLGAWQAIEAGRYRPDPSMEPRSALRVWLHGVTWRHASHYRERSSVRHEVPHPSPLGLLRSVVGPDLHAQIEARNILEVLAELRPEHREILLAVDGPESLAAYARRRGMNPHSAASRLRLAREALALKLQRWRR